MDQDDRHSDIGEENAAENAGNSFNGATTEANDSSVTFNALTHSRPEVAAAGDSFDTGPAEIHTTEIAAVGPEVEPATAAYSSKDTPSKTPLQAAESPEHTAANVKPASVPASMPAAAKANKKYLYIAIAASVALCIVVGMLSWWLLQRNADTPAVEDATLSTSVPQPKLGVALTVVDSVVEYSSDNAKWQDATTETSLQEGDFVRTGVDSRAVLTLDDGSAVRLDAETNVKLASLNADAVAIELIEGSAYSRVVPSDRTYTVNIGDTTYTALGTAFMTTNENDASGVQVYQSSVMVSGIKDAITEGKQYYKRNNDNTLQGKLTSIDIDALTDDTFLGWNLSQDESNKDFRDKLGVLAKIKARIAEKKAAHQAAAKHEVEQTLRQQAAAEKNDHTDQNGTVTRGTMTLWLDGKTFNWNYTGKAVHGYKLVYSKKRTPTFGKSDAVYFNDMKQTEGRLPGKQQIDKGHYYVRVCAYTDDTEDDACVDYSNTVSIDIE